MARARLARHGPAATGESQDRPWRHPRSARSRPATVPIISSVTMRDSTRLICGGYSLHSPANISPLISRQNSAQTRVPASRKRELIDEIRRQHEGVAERMADLGRIDLGAIGGGCPVSCSNSRTGPRGWMFHGRHLFRRETAPASCCPRLGHPRRLFAAMSWAEQMPCRGRARRPALRISVKTTIGLAARAVPRMSPGDPHERAGSTTSRFGATTESASGGRGCDRLAQHGL